MDGVLHWIVPAAAQVEQAQLGVHLAEVGHGRHDAVFQNFDGDHVFHADAHRMAGEALGVGYDDIVGRLAEGVAQGGHFGRSAAAARRGIGFM